MKKLLNLLVSASVVALFGSTTALVQAAPLLASSVYKFTGNCADCAEAAGQDAYAVSATVGLQSYLPNDGPVSWDVYHANYWSFTYSGSNRMKAFTLKHILNDFSTGGFGANPSATDFFITGVDIERELGFFFRSHADGTWSLGYGSGDEGHQDIGDGGLFTVASVTLPTDTQNLPEPGSLLLAGAGLAAVAVVAKARRRRAV